MGSYTNSIMIKIGRKRKGVIAAPRAQGKMYLIIKLDLVYCFIEKRKKKIAEKEKETQWIYIGRP